jgi:hypothetical protein
LWFFPGYISNFFNSFCSIKFFYEKTFFILDFFIFQVFCYIYFPVWVDQFGVSGDKILWLTLLQLGVPVGTMIGYVMEAYFIEKYDSVKIILFYLFLIIVERLLLCSNIFTHNWNNFVNFNTR